MDNTLTITHASVPLMTGAEIALLISEMARDQTGSLCNTVNKSGGTEGNLHLRRQKERKK